MNVKWFLRGLGAGILITALVLCITYRSTQNNSNVIQQAKALGMVFPQNETGDISEAEPAKNVKKSYTEKPSVSGAAVKAESNEDKKAKDKLDKSSKDITKASQYQNGEKTFVVIKSGLLSMSVAKEMEKAGIIDDAEAFDEYIRENGYEKNLQSGKYKIPEGADFETIAKIISSKQQK